MSGEAPTDPKAEDPLIMIYRQDGKVFFEFNPRGSYSGHESYGVLVCDLVRHIANSFQVDEEAVWKWVDKERLHHTIEFKRLS
jgi:hypothetical protein